jgi:hypothetical protein
MDRTAMHYRIMSDRYLIAYVGSGFLVGTMDDYPILNICLIAYPDLMHISSYHGIEPNRTFISHDYITYHSGIRR